MRASATIAVARCGDRDVVVDQRSAAPLSVRQCGQRILLASSAAAPVGGDDLELVVDVGPGARADVGSVAASIVWPGVGGEASSMTTECVLGHGAHLDLWLEPTISVAGSRHRAVTVVRLEGDATCRVVEEAVLGRRHEASGHLDLSLRVERDGRPLVHHDERFGPDVAGAWSSVSVGAARFVLTAVLVGIDAGSPRVCVEADRAAAWLPVAVDASVVMAVGHDRPSAMSLLAALSPAFT
ncbi:MAG: urease accessory protein UreD [Acidimicrobiales bacterium]